MLLIVAAVLRASDLSVFIIKLLLIIQPFLRNLGGPLIFILIGDVLLQGDVLGVEGVVLGSFKVGIFD
jgi:hypothetical protein